jgi:hypothetical protein
MKFRHEPAKFQNPNLARSCAYRSGMRVVLGDDGTFWVVCPADAATLERNGYEVI